jgi:hypothetical protein
VVPKVGTPPTPTPFDLTAVDLIFNREHPLPTFAVTLIRAVDVHVVVTEQTPVRDPAQILIRSGDVPEGLQGL